MTYRGWVLPVKEAIPRTKTVKSEPGFPEGCRIWVPGDLPAKTSAALTTGRSLTSDTPTVDIAEIISFLRCEPYPINTISSSEVELSRKVTSIVVLLPTDTSIPSYPTKLKC